MDNNDVSKSKNKTKKQITLKPKHVVLTFIVSWVVTLILGIAMFMFCSWFTYGFLYPEDGIFSNSYGARMYSISSLLNALMIIFIILFINRWKKVLYFKYTKIALSIGLSLITIIFILSTVELFRQIPSIDNNELNCTSLQDKLNVANGAIAPLATEFGTGTAFAIDNNGTYLTAYHVVDGAEKIYLNLVSGEKILKIQSVVPEYDIALLKSEESTPHYLNLTSKYSQAEPVYTLGYPGNAFTAGGPSVSAGLISRVLTNDDLKLTDENIPLGLEMIQTDAAINPGNSGGPLINRCGVVGVISSVSDKNQLQAYGLVSEQGISYAISSSSIALKLGINILSK